MSYYQSNKLAHDPPDMIYSFTSPYPIVHKLLMGILPYMTT